MHSTDSAINSAYSSFWPSTNDWISTLRTEQTGSIELLKTNSLVPRILMGPQMLSILKDTSLLFNPYFALLHFLQTLFTIGHVITANASVCPHLFHKMYNVAWTKPSSQHVANKFQKKHLMGWETKEWLGEQNVIAHQLANFSRQWSWFVKSEVSNTPPSGLMQQTKEDNKTLKAGLHLIGRSFEVLPVVNIAEKFALRLNRWHMSKITHAW